MILEIAKCKRDIVYFAEHYYRVINLDKGLHIIKLYDVQKEFLRYLVDNNKVICVSGRQQGKSTIYCIYSLWLTTFFPEKKVMILANKLATALELLGRIQTGWEYLPKWLKAGCTVFNKSELSFSNKSSIRAFASSSDAARGFSCNCVSGSTKVRVRFKWLPFISFSLPIKYLCFFGQQHILRV